MEKNNPFVIAQQQVDEAAKFVEIDKELLEILKEPQKNY